VLAFEFVVLSATLGLVFSLYICTIHLFMYVCVYIHTYSILINGTYVNTYVYTYIHTYMHACMHILYKTTLFKGFTRWGALGALSHEAKFK
jgi:hypothetical protein